MALICRESGIKALTENSKIETLPDNMQGFEVEMRLIEKSLEEVKNRGKSEDKPSKNGVLF